MARRKSYLTFHNKVTGFVIVCNIHLVGLTSHYVTLHAKGKNAENTVYACKLIRTAQREKGTISPMSDQANMNVGSLPKPRRSLDL